MRWKPFPPKQSETDGKTVKKQKIDKLLGREPKKSVDKPLQSVYNIRKDMAEVQYLYDTFLKGKHGGSFNHSDLVYSLDVANKVATNIFKSIDVDIPILAGGAIRDLFYNRRPKDYDYFVNCQDEGHAYEVMDKLCLHLEDYTEGGQREEYGTDDGDFEGVYGVFNKTYYNLPLQFIVGIWPTKERFYDRFDLSICQAEMDITTGDMFLSDAFLETVRTKNIILFRDSKYSRARRDRLKYTLYLSSEQEVNIKPLGTKSLQASAYGWIINDQGEFDAAPIGDAMPQMPVE